MNITLNQKSPIENNSSDHGKKSNWLRAGVLGANDGIVSIASIIVGVASVSNSRSFILTAGVAALVAGALSMAVGEYVSVSSQKDTEKALLLKEKIEIKTDPGEELKQLISIYEEKGLSEKTAKLVAEELTANDAFAAHADAELGINPHELTNPFHAAYASGLAFLTGAIIPIIAIFVSPSSLYIPVTFLSAICALVITGTLSAHIGRSKKLTAVIRVVLGGILAMVITYGIGKLFGVSE